MEDEAGGAGPARSVRPKAAGSPLVADTLRGGTNSGLVLLVLWLGHGLLRAFRFHLLFWGLVGLTSLAEPAGCLFRPIG